VPVDLFGQYPTQSKPKKGALVFSPPQKKQTKFRKKYIGTINGRAMELGFIEKRIEEQLKLSVILTDLLTNTVYIGQAKVEKTTYLLNAITLKDSKNESIQIRSLYLHNYNPNFLNLITSDGLAGCFAWDAKGRYESNYPARKFTAISDFNGYYEGRIDGRWATLKIENSTEGILFNLMDKEHKIRYWTILPHFPVGATRFSLSNIALKSTTSSQEIAIGEMVLDNATNQIISGHFIIKDKPVGLFFIRRLPAEPSLIPEFPWPPPTASDLVKIPDDLFFHVDSLGGVDQLISSSLDKSGYRFRPNKYFYTPNGFALVTELEQVDCNAAPLAGEERWNITPSNIEKNFSLLDYLRSLVTKEEGLYRVFVFIVTDDLNPAKSIEPTIEETQGWLVSGSAKLPIPISSIPLNENHYCRAYVYEFSKTDQQIQATMVKKGEQACWRSGETHLKNTNILEHLVIRP